MTCPLLTLSHKALGCSDYDRLQRAACATFFFDLALTITCLVTAILGNFGIIQITPAATYALFAASILIPASVGLTCCWRF